MNAPSEPRVAALLLIKLSALDEAASARDKDPASQRLAWILRRARARGPGFGADDPLPPVPLFSSLFSSPPAPAETCKRRRRSSGALIQAAVFGRAHRQNAPPDRGRHPRQLPVRQLELLSSTCGSSRVFWVFFPDCHVITSVVFKSRRGATESHSRRVHTGALPPVFSRQRRRRLNDSGRAGAGGRIPHAASSRFLLRASAVEAG